MGDGEILNALCFVKIALFVNIGYSYILLYKCPNILDYTVL